MTTVPRWFGHVDADGQLRLGVTRGFRAWLKTLAGKRVEVVVRPQVKKRSHQQNAFWWAVVVPMFAERCGYLPNEHEAVHDELLRVLVGLKPDSHPELQIRRSSTDLSTEEFNRLIEQAQIFAAEKLGLVIPDPDPEWARRPKKAA